MEKIKFISIVSPKFSGSTLLSYLLSTDNNVTTLGEYNYFCRFMLLNKGLPHLCSCGKRIIDCENWVSIKSNLEEKFSSDILRLNFSQFQFFSNRMVNKYYAKIINKLIFWDKLHLAPMALLNRYNIISEANLTIIGQACQRAGRYSFIDTSKSFLNCMYLSKNPNIESYAVHLIRDGRAQLFSALKRDVKNGRVRSAKVAARKWKKHITSQIKILKKISVPYITLKYEDLCADPQKNIQNILNFAGIEKGENNINEFSSNIKHAYGNSGTTFSGHTDIADKKEWQVKLSEKELDEFTEISGELNRKLGYN